MEPVETTPEELNIFAKWEAFENELAALINRHSLEGICGDTPDWILARVAASALSNFGEQVQLRSEWYSDDESPAAEQQFEKEQMGSGY